MGRQQKSKRHFVPAAESASRHTERGGRDRHCEAALLCTAVTPVIEPPTALHRTAG